MHFCSVQMDAVKRELKSQMGKIESKMSAMESSNLKLETKISSMECKMDRILDLLAAAPRDRAHTA